MNTNRNTGGKYGQEAVGGDRHGDTVAQSSGCQNQQLFAGGWLLSLTSRLTVRVKHSNIVSLAVDHYNQSKDAARQAA